VQAPPDAGTLGAFTWHHLLFRPLFATLVATGKDLWQLSVLEQAAGGAPQR